MEFILEYKKFFDIGDEVYIYYWYKHILTPVKILEKIENKYKVTQYKVTHNIEGSKIKNAPDELIKTSEVISIVR